MEVKMKYHKIIIFQIAGLLLLTGCSQKNEIDETETTFSSVAKKQTAQKVLPDGLEIVRDSSLFQPVTQNQAYNYETDDRYAIENNYGVTETEDAYYFLEQYDTSTLYIWDKASKQISPLCSKPDCTHSIGSSNCNANVKEAWQLYYYEGNLYTIAVEDSENENGQNGEKIILRKISLDGSVKEDICTIAQCYITEDNNYSDNTFTVRGIVHRGYLYYLYNFGTGDGAVDVDYYNNNSNILYRIKLDGSEEPECIHVLKECGNSSSLSMKGIGSYIYFVDTQWDSQGILYRLNTESMQLEEMGIGKINSYAYAVLEDKIIYKENMLDTVLYSYTPETGEKTVFADMTGRKENYKFGSFEYDGTYFYLYFVSEENNNVWTRVVLDKQGKEVGEFCFYEEGEEAEDWIKAYAGMGDLFLCSTGYDAMEKVFYYLEKEQIANGNAKFTEGSR